MLMLTLNLSSYLKFMLQCLYRPLLLLPLPTHFLPWLVKHLSLCVPVSNATLTAALNVTLLWDLSSLLRSEEQDKSGENHSKMKLLYKVDDMNTLTTKPHYWHSSTTKNCKTVAAITFTLAVCFIDHCYILLLCRIYFMGALFIF
jgi:hypothetical protein